MKDFKEKRRREEVIISRLRLGHTGFKSSLYLLAKYLLDKCDDSKVAENVEHVMNCSKYDVVCSLRSLNRALFSS